MRKWDEFGKNVIYEKPFYYSNDDFFSLKFRYGVTDPNFREFTLAKSYVFTAGVLTTARPWDVSPQTSSARIAFVR